MTEMIKKDTVSLEVEISIAHLELEVKEAFSKEETDLIY